MPFSHLEGQQLAAIDMGSNSFHLLIARINQGQLQRIDSLSEKVSLGAGFDEKQRLTPEAREKALACLARFAQRIQDIPNHRIHVVGTNALRMAKESRGFLKEVEDTLGAPANIIAGREEARLIYIGVSNVLPEETGNRLVVDIGGGSTELIIGHKKEPILTESLHMGCVSYAQRYFSDGKINNANFTKALRAAEQELSHIEDQYKSESWSQAIGTSGTANAIFSMIEAQGWNDHCFTLEDLERLRDMMFEFKRVEDLNLPALKEERRHIAPAGLAIMFACFSRFGIKKMSYSSGALREGVLYDALGRENHQDVRDRSVSSLMQRYQVDEHYAEAVRDQAFNIFSQVKKDWDLDQSAQADLGRAALLHEVGLAISHSQFHKHGAYIIEHSDLAGFSMREQSNVASLVRGHRRKMPVDILEAMENSAVLLRLMVILRLAIIFAQGRGISDVPEFHVGVADNHVYLALDKSWLENHPLTASELEQESHYLKKACVHLQIK